MIVSNSPAKRRENSVFPFFGTANDRMPVKKKTERETVQIHDS